MPFIENHHITTDGPCGFRSNHSTSIALSEFLEMVTSAVDRRESTIGVFVHLTTTLVTVDHEILRNKLQCCGIRGLALDWINSYLTNHTQCVRYNWSNADLKVPSPTRIYT